MIHKVPPIHRNQFRAALGAGGCFFITFCLYSNFKKSLKTEFIDEFHTVLPDFREKPRECIMALNNLQATYKFPESLLSRRMTIDKVLASKDTKNEADLPYSIKGLTEGMKTLSKTDYYKSNYLNKVIDFLEDQLPQLDYNVFMQGSHHMANEFATWKKEGKELVPDEELFLDVYSLNHIQVIPDLPAFFKRSNLEFLQGFTFEEAIRMYMNFHLDTVEKYIDFREQKELSKQRLETIIQDFEPLYTSRSTMTPLIQEINEKRGSQKIVFHPLVHFHKSALTPTRDYDVRKISELDKRLNDMLCRSKVLATSQYDASVEKDVALLKSQVKDLRNSSTQDLCKKGRRKLFGIF